MSSGDPGLVGLVVPWEAGQLGGQCLGFVSRQWGLSFFPPLVVPEQKLHISESVFTSVKWEFPQLEGIL